MDRMGVILVVAAVTYAIRSAGFAAPAAPGQALGGGDERGSALGQAPGGAGGRDGCLLGHAHADRVGGDRAMKARADDRHSVPAPT